MTRNTSLLDRAAEAASVASRYCDEVDRDSRFPTESMQALKDAMADMTMDFTHVVAEGDLVSIRFVTKAKNVGKFMGAPATRKNVVITGQFTRRIQGDRVMQEWQSTDLLGLMTQMGFGTLLGYTIAAGLLGKQSPPPARRLT